HLEVALRLQALELAAHFGQEVRVARERISEELSRVATEGDLFEVAPARPIVANRVVPLVVIEAAPLFRSAAQAPGAANVDPLRLPRPMNSRGGNPQAARENPCAARSPRGTSDLQDRPRLQEPAQLLGGKRRPRPLFVAFLDRRRIDVEHLGRTRLAAR